MGIAAAAGAPNPSRGGGGRCCERHARTPHAISARRHTSFAQPLSTHCALQYLALLVVQRLTPSAGPMGSRLVVHGPASIAAVVPRMRDRTGETTSVSTWRTDGMNAY